MGFLRRVLSAAVAEFQRQGAERERVRQESELRARINEMLARAGAAPVTKDDVILRMVIRASEPVAKRKEYIQ